MKNLIVMIVLLFCFSTVSVQAGSARRHTIEGIIIGTGMVILGTAIINEMDRGPIYQNRTHYYHYYNDGYKYRRVQKYYTYDYDYHYREYNGHQYRHNKPVYRKHYRK